MIHVGRILAVALALSALAASCGETNIQAIRRLAPRGTEVRARLRSIASRLPAPGTVTRAQRRPGSLLPGFVLDFRRRQHSADVLMEQQLSDPDRELPFDLLLSPHLLHCLEWTGPKNPLDRSVWDDSGDLGPECERAFSVPWLVVVRTLRHDLPERVDLEVFVVHVPEERVVASFPIHLRGRYAKADVGRGRFASRALDDIRSDAFVAARCAVASRLSTLPGAQVDIAESWLGTVRDPCARGAQSSFSLVEPQPEAAVVADPTTNR